DDVVRLATHVLILEKGKSVVSGAISTVMSRPDVPWLREAFALGAVFDASVTQVLTKRGLVELGFTGGTILAPDHGTRVGSTVRVRIPAREVILATREPEGLSLHNVLVGTVTAIQDDRESDRVIVQIGIGELLLL